MQPLPDASGAAGPYAARHGPYAARLKYYELQQYRPGTHGPARAVLEFGSNQTTAPMATRISDLFAARLAELEQKHRESEARTKATLASIQATVAELKALDLSEH